ncbi:KIF13B [Cordylochernes scorpioides]|uniref:KIF13B n=1 Tax=Cordylochernes scorpioides TaxID=51811 RepID=A0ABY6LCX8_9ARAC|nr:KIF13B [Cordylochernes scorpioides]
MPSVLSKSPCGLPREDDLQFLSVQASESGQLVLASRWYMQYQNTAVCRKQPKTFAFDQCFWSFCESDPNFASQQQVYECLGSDILDNAFQGYNACIFAYGQTGSGKSYTMMGSETDKGLIPRLCDGLFERIASNSVEDTTYKVEVSYMEIYNEKVHDLLDPKGKQSLKVREHNILGSYVDGLASMAVTSYDEIINQMTAGNKSRTVAATNMNSESSRSHAVFNITLTCSMTDQASGVTGEKVSKMSLVDLAGSERAVKTGAVGERLKEGSNINKSLTTLGLVISKLADQASSKAADKFVPYRDSVLTWLLKQRYVNSCVQDNLGGNSKTVMVATISPAADNYEETLSTLRYADRAKRIVNHAVVNEDPKAKIIRELRKEVDVLREQLKHATVWQDPTQQKEDVHERLVESEKFIKELSQTWEEKLRKTEKIHQERQQALEKMGISVQASGIKVEKDKYYLVNLNADPSLNELLVYYLKERTLVGRHDAPVEQDIQLKGLGIMPEHCIISLEEGDIFVTPLEGARTCVNGSVITERTQLRHGDRLLWGNNHFFRLNCPKAGTPSQPSGRPIDYEFAREELMMKELSNDPIQSAVKALERQHEEDKHHALEQQRQLYERQLQKLRSQMSPSTPYAPYSLGGIDPLWGKLAAGGLPSPGVQSRVERWTRERDDLFKKSLAKLREDIARANQLVREANFLAEEMGKRTHFKVTLQIPAANLGPNRRRRGAFVSEPAILVRREPRGSQVWSMEKLENKLIDMREMFESGVRRAEDDPKVADPFYESQENHNLIGVANVFLEVLFHDVTLDYHVPVISQQGEIAGKLHVEVGRVAGALGDREGDAAEGPVAPQERYVVLRVAIKAASGLPQSLANFVFCQYQVWGTEEPVVVPPLINPDLPPNHGSSSFRFDHSRDVRLPLTEEFLEHCAEGALSIEVWGHKSAGFSSAKPGWELDPRLQRCRSLADRWVELTRKIELWVEIHELTDAGVYAPVEVTVGRTVSGVLTGGVFQLRQGQQRRVVVRVRPVQDSGTLPIICEAITGVWMGCVTARSSLQRPLDSYQEEELGLLRERWSEALLRRQQYLEDQIQRLAAKPDKDVEREQSLIDQWVSLTEERNAVTVPAAGSNIPGAPADWDPPIGMERHIPVIFLDLNADDMNAPISGESSIRVAGANAILPKEHGGKMFPLPIVRCCEKEVCAFAAWDSSIHDSVHLNRITPPAERVYLILKASVRLSHPATMDLVLRKRLLINVYKRQSFTERIRKKIARTGLAPHCMCAVQDGLQSVGVMYEVVANIPKASEEVEARESLALAAATDDGESYIENYTRGVSAVETILTLDRLRQQVAVKELLAAQGRPLRKTHSVPNIAPPTRIDAPFRSDSLSELPVEPPTAPNGHFPAISRPTFLNLALNLNLRQAKSPLTGGPQPLRGVKPMRTVLEEQTQRCEERPLLATRDSEESFEEEEEERDKLPEEEDDVEFSEFESYQSCSLDKASPSTTSEVSQSAPTAETDAERSCVQPKASSGYGSQATPEDTASLRSLEEATSDSPAEPVRRRQRTKTDPAQRNSYPAAGSQREQRARLTLPLDAILPPSPEPSDSSSGEPSPVPPPEEDGLPPWLTVGECVMISPYNKTGMVAYIGPTEFAPHPWVGVELDTPTGQSVSNGLHSSSCHHIASESGQLVLASRWYMQYQNTAVCRKQPKTFAFDQCFWSFCESDPNFASQQQVYECLGSDILDNAFQGYNACIFAYGQTGSGKSYTMMGSETDKGLIPRLCDGLFERIASNSVEDTTYKVEVSYMEIYNEKVHDLLDPKGKQSLKVREHNILGSYVDGLASMAVTSYDEIINQMTAGNKSRTVAATNMNSESSRSHAVFNITLTCSMTDQASGVTGEKVSKMSLVDLAGSERAVKTGAVGERLKEGSNINKSLTTLGLVISKLADQASSKAADKFVPYRDSVLTWLLKHRYVNTCVQDNLGGNSKTVMVATISPAADNYEETLSTLRYADRAKRIVNHAVVNEDPKAKIIRELRKEVDVLREQLKHATVWQDPTQQKEDVHERLVESEKFIKELSQTWEEKLRKTEKIHQERQQALEKMGISVQASGIKVEKDKYYLVNLNADPSLNELLVYYLKERTLVGRHDAPVEQDIQLKGLGIMPEHCIISLEEGDIFVTPLEGARTCVNGSVITERTQLRHGDRLLWGNNHFFRLNCPKAGTPSQPSGRPIDYEFAREELMMKELSNDPIQSAVKALERQHEEDKHHALEQQRQLYERQLQKLRSQMSPSTPYAPYSLGGIDPLWGKLAAGGLPSPGVQSRVERWTRERDDLFKKSLAKLREDIARANQLVREANFLAEEMGKRTHFKVTLQIPAANLGPNRRRRGAFVSEPAILVRREPRGSQVWSMEKLENKLIDMREMFESGVRRAEDDPKVADPFYESQENHNLIGVANVFLEVLFHDVTLDYHVPVISQQGEIAGKLHVEVGRVAGALGDREGDAAEGPVAPQERYVVLRVAIKAASGLPQSLANFVFCQYQVWGTEEPVVVPPLINPDLPPNHGSSSFRFDHSRDVRLPLTEEFLEHCAEGALSIEVWGHKSAGFSSAKPGWELDPRLQRCRSLADRWVELTRKIELWVEIHELTDAGVYAPVEVTVGRTVSGVLTGGVFQLRQGQQRRVVVRVRPVQDSGTLPIICEAITGVWMGCVTARSSLQRPLDSYQEEELGLLRERWSEALLRRQQYLEDQIQRLAAKPDKDVEREQSLIDQWVSLTEERNAVTVPAAGSNIPGAPADWDPPIGMERHIPVIFLDLNADDMNAPISGESSIRVAGANAILPKEHGGKMFPLPIVRCCEKEVCAFAAWDSSIHDSVHLNRITPPAERVYLILKASVRLSHPATMDLVLRKRLLINVYKRQSFTERIRKKIARTGLAPHCMCAVQDGLQSVGVMYEVVANIPKASEEVEARESLALAAATDDGESYIENYTRGVSAVETILTLDRLRQQVAVKELLAAQGRPLRKTHSVPNIAPPTRIDAPFRSDSLSELPVEPPTAPNGHFPAISRPTFLNLALNLNLRQAKSPLTGGPQPLRGVKPMRTVLEEQTQRCEERPLLATRDSEESFEEEEEERDKLPEEEDDVEFSEFESYQSCSLDKASPSTTSEVSQSAPTAETDAERSCVQPKASSGYGSQATPEDTASLRSLEEATSDSPAEPVRRRQRTKTDPAQRNSYPAAGSQREQRARLTLPLDAILPPSPEPSDSSSGEPSPVPPPEEDGLPPWLTVGECVMISPYNKTGMVAYIGPTEFAPHPWVGVELDTPTGQSVSNGLHSSSCHHIAMIIMMKNVQIPLFFYGPGDCLTTVLCAGKNDGSVNGVRYFQCKPKFGIFVRPDKLVPDRRGRAVRAARQAEEPAKKGTRNGSKSRKQTAPLRSFSVSLERDRCAEI